jgi:oligoribonuclease
MDRRFLAVYLPEIEEWLHYRSVDVSSVKELARRWHPEVIAKRPFKTGQHRALDDIRESVTELQYYRERVFLPSPSPNGGSEADEHALPDGIPDVIPDVITE